MRPLAERSFNTITHTADIRQRQSSVALCLDDVCSKVPLEFDESLHGCHRWCYTNFTKVSKFALKSNDNKDSEEDSCTSTTSSRSGRNASACAASEGNTSNSALFAHDQRIFVVKIER